MSEYRDEMHIESNIFMSVEVTLRDCPSLKLAATLMI